MNNQQKKQLLRVSILVIFIGLVFFWFIGRSNKEGASSQKDTGAEQGLITPSSEDEKHLTELANKDTDGDGLKDWEETLWKTDINKKDTDEDQTSDGEEVLLKRDPTKAGPNDSLSVVEADTSSTVTLTPTESLTQTETLAVDFFNNYLSTQGANVDPSVQEYLNKQLISKIDNQNIELLTIKDLRIVNNNDNLSLKNFGNQFGMAFVNDYAFLGENVFILIESTLAGDQESFQTLKDLPKKYDLLINKMLELNVPSELKDIMLEFLNNLYKSKQLITRMSVVGTDPISAMLAIKDYREVVGFIERDMAKFNLFFISKGVTFEMKEYGYLFQAL